MPLPKNAKLDTQLLHAGHDPAVNNGSAVVPIYQTVAYNFRDTEHAANLFSLKEVGNIYTRLTNPTNGAFEERVAALEGGIGALAFASGHAAIAGIIWNLCQSGDEIVSSTNLYGGTYNMFSYSMAHLGIKVNFAENCKPENFRKAITPKTKALFAETIGNPRMDVADIEAIAAIAHEAGIPLIIDATFTPYLNRAIDFGADIIVHSATKFIGGHGTCMGGIVVDSGKFNYDSDKFPLLSQPDPSYHGLRFCDIGAAAFITRLRTQVMRDLGACLSPFNAFMFIIGLETLHLRMERHSQNALAVAEWLAGHPNVAWVSYPSLPTHPDHALAKKYMPKGAGAIMTFGIKGGLEAGRKFIDSLQLFSHLANVGDAKSLVIHPASTTHSQLTPEQLASTGTTEDMVRLSVGIEDTEDIIADLKQALEK
ncbi:MAG: O-acetylhomoserine aminocarboxypropyltransferase/cysteine synthase [Defluviitaleaceae bacterium]|nr:O-acetylhomoserine aminocarboxypropyltransferase/cysteine synthase [Defluviitaleaceae bacterium]MCL2275795.1 O-acetylhomoserine aminocarboxypropyltransferase/cysteine synthase [Defluviitaleaceae bacterium]